jgi:hypothetical protein
MSRPLYNNTNYIVPVFELRNTGIQFSPIFLNSDHCSSLSAWIRILIQICIGILAADPDSREMYGDPQNRWAV